MAPNKSSFLDKVLGRIGRLDAEGLTTVVERLRFAGFVPGNVDIIIHAERPNLSPHKPIIARSIAEMLRIPVSDVNVKAKTNEGLGPVGTREGMACSVVVCIHKA